MQWIVEAVNRKNQRFVKIRMVIWRLQRQLVKMVPIKRFSATPLQEIKAKRLPLKKELTALGARSEQLQIQQLPSVITLMEQLKFTWRVELLMREPLSLLSNKQPTQTLLTQQLWRLMVVWQHQTSMQERIPVLPLHQPQMPISWPSPIHQATKLWLQLSHWPKTMQVSGKTKQDLACQAIRWPWQQEPLKQAQQFLLRLKVQTPLVWQEKLRLSLLYQKSMVVALMQMR